MNQPPKSDRPAQWRRPEGVAPGTWAYVNQRTIADHYDAFVADTPLCRIDAEILGDLFPAKGACGQTVLDLGCGTGRTAIQLAAAGYDLVGVDLSGAMLRVLMSKTAERATVDGGVCAVRANLVDLSCFADQVADHAICMFSTLGMIRGRQQRRTMLGHVRRIVRPGGRLVIHVHNRWSAVREPRGLSSLARSWIRSRWDPNHEFGDATYAYRGIENMFMHRFTGGELIRDFRATGWSIERLLAISIDGSRVIDGGVFRFLRAGGYIAVGRRWPASS